MQTQIHKHSFLDLLTTTPTVKHPEQIPGSVIHRSSFKDEDGDQKQRVHIRKEKREALRKELIKVLKKGNKNYYSLYTELLAKKPDLIPTNELGERISEYSFRDLVLKVKRELWGDFKGRTGKKKIIELHKSGLSRFEIRDQVKCSLDHITKVLVEAGLIERKYKQKAK